MPRHDDLGVSAYNASHAEREIHTEPRAPRFITNSEPIHPEAQTALPHLVAQKRGRSRGTTPLSTLPLRTRTARGRPRTPEPDSVAAHGATSGVPEPIARALGRKRRSRLVAFILGRRS